MSPVRRVCGAARGAAAVLLARPGKVRSAEGGTLCTVRSAKEPHSAHGALRAVTPQSRLGRRGRPPAEL